MSSDAMFFMVGIIAGLCAGVGITVFGFRLGFKASREIRMFKDPESVDLLPSKKDPPEFALADQQEKDDIDDDNEGVQ